MRHLLERVIRIKLKDEDSPLDVLASKVPQAFGIDEDFAIHTQGFELVYTIRAGQAVRTSRQGPGPERLHLVVPEMELRAILNVRGRLVDFVETHPQQVIDDLDLGPGRSLTVETPEGPLYFKRVPKGLEYQPKYPSHLQLFRNFLSAMAQTATAPGPKFVTAEAYAARRAICGACEFWDRQKDRCTKCGCFAKAKLRLAAQHCPIHRWGPTTAVDNPPDADTD